MTRALPGYSSRAFPNEDARSFPTVGEGILPIQPDPNFSSVTLLLHAEGNDADTTMIDFSDVGATPTFVANAQIDTAQDKFGGSSLLVDGTGDWVTFPDNAGYSFDAGDFTIDLQVRRNTDIAGMILSKYSGSSTTAEWYLYYNATALIWVSYYGTGANSFLTFQGSWDLSTDTWRQLGMDRSGDTWRLYVDGSVVASHSVSRTLKNSTEQLRLGARNHGSPIEFNGWIDEVRITKGVARYAGTHVVQTNPWQNE